eukprot:scaffold108454_cov76-Phaeocystis_antarctica.AAC.4
MRLRPFERPGACGPRVQAAPRRRQRCIGRDRATSFGGCSVSFPGRRVRKCSLGTKVDTELRSRHELK